MPVGDAKKRAALELILGSSALLVAVWLVQPRPTPPVPASATVKTPLPPEERSAPARLAASYTLEARLDAKSHRISGSGTIDWQNTSRSGVRSLFFHLYLNAFKNDRTLYLRSPFAAGRGGAHASEFGYIDLKFLRARELGGGDLWPSRARHSPGDPEDETDIEVPLPSEVPAGGRLTLEVSFEAQLPEIVERSGYSGSFHFVSQWFPKLAKLENDGSFAHFAFHPQAEFYADFGRYDVTLDVPDGFVVGATGARVEDKREKGRRRSRYVAEPVHDFAWTAWDGFREHHARVGKVEVTLLTPPGHTKTEAATLDAIAFALPYFSRKYGSYPYSTLTVVHPPDGAESAGGMEYPTLITTGAPWYMPYTGVRALESVTVHELGHQWFYGLLASNEAASPFLDEGLNSHAELSALFAQHGQGSSFAWGGLSVEGHSLFRVFSAARGHDEAVAEPAAEFASFRNLGALVYSRTATLLETVSRVWGRERTERALLAYAERYRFGHPTPADFLGVMREFLAPEVAEMLNVALFQRGSVDYLVRDVESATERSPAGFFERPSGREKVTRTPEGAPRYRGRATVYRRGRLEIPVEVLLIGEDGTRTLERWDGRGFLKTFEYTGARRLSHVVVDPDHKILIDDDLLNNQAATRTATLARVHERLGYFAAVALGAGP
ncbi:MAG TPA: M1 family metallopeptidase [Polyangiaceae bacterium]|nr:M1 family metallopeptidase [Polyangiaceae bacterium]